MIRYFVIGYIPNEDRFDLMKRSEFDSYEDAYEYASGCSPTYNAFVVQEVKEE